MIEAGIGFAIGGAFAIWWEYQRRRLRANLHRDRAQLRRDLAGLQAGLERNAEAVAAARLKWENERAARRQSAERGRAASRAEIARLRRMMDPPTVAQQTDPALAPTGDNGGNRWAKR